MAQRVVVLEKGRIVANGTFEELEKQPGTFRNLLDAAGGSGM
jgi:ABC-type multidrug transport system fused ATPase/permease subunit